MENNNFLYIEPHVYVNVAKNGAILFNTINKKLIDCRKDDVNGYSFLTRVKENSSQGSIQLYKREVLDSSISKLLTKIRNTHMGDIMSSNTRLVSSRPRFRITDSVEALMKNEDLTVGFKAKTYLKEIILFSGSKFNCKQFQKAIYPKSIDQGNNSNFGSIQLTKLFSRLIDEINEYQQLKNINIIYTETLGKEHLLPLVNALKNKKSKITIHFSIVDSNRIKSLLIPDLNYSIYIPNNIPVSNTLIKTLDSEYTCLFNFIVMETQDLYSIHQLRKTTNVDIHPFPVYKENFQFFEENVFIDPEDIISQKIDLRHISMNRSINQNFFGKIYINEYGQLSSSLTMESRIILDETNRIIDFIIIELQENRSWRLLRSHVSPCKDCKFNELCPPISRLEFEMNRYNLCKVPI